MEKFIALFILFFMIPAVSAVCTTPSEDLEIRENVVLCYGNYNIESGITVTANNVSIDCSNSILAGNGIGYGILLKANNALIQNCNISNYEIGIYLDSSNGSAVRNNHLHNNKFGAALFNSFGSEINDNNLADNLAGNSISYLPASLTEGEKVREEEKLSIPQDIMEEVIKIKKPNLRQDEVEKEIDEILGRYFNMTQENLEITRTIFYNESEGSTGIILNLKPKKILLNVSIYERIPKCVSSYVNQILFETGGYEIIQDDPLVLWIFSRLDNEKEITYKVLKNIDKECKSLLFAFGIASGFQEFEKAEVKKEKNRNYLFAAIMAALMSIAAIYFIKKKLY